MRTLKAPRVSAVRVGNWSAAATASILALCATATSSGAASPALELTATGELAIDGRRVSCKSNIRTILDASLPNLGIATRSQLVLNPQLLKRMSPVVRLFVYHHECGHHHVGGDEFGADCWAVRSGVSNGWLQQRQLGEICASFGNSRATLTHPATATRCRALQACYADAVVTVPAQATASAGSPQVAQPPGPTPTPQLVHEGFATTTPLDR